MKKYEESQNRFPLSELSPSEYRSRARGEAEFRCAEIAIALGETDMRFMLARLHQFGGSMHPLDEAYSIVKDAVRRGKCRDPRKLFNYLTSKKLREYEQAKTDDG